jgi:catechol 2,3-dioxygenase-like lactoylglutathione lyase family enzyme
MLHHVSFGVSDIRRSAAFYDAVLAALGYVRVWDDISDDDPDCAVGYGYSNGGDKFAIKLRAQALSGSVPGFHLAFAAPSRAAVDEFHKAALLNGGKDNGAAGLRPDYGDEYYAAFVIDPDGYHIEAVINGAEQV